CPTDGTLVLRGPQRRIKGPGTDCRVKKTDCFAFWQQAQAIAEDVVGKPAGCRELSQPVAFDLCFLAIQCGLQGKALFLLGPDVPGFGGHGHIPNNDRSSIRCSHTQSMPSAAS